MGQLFQKLPSWSSDKQEITRRISGSPARLKIVLKAKDEIHFLRRWIDHHEAIVGIDNLIIFDNMSGLSEVEEVYAHYGPDLQVIRFSTFHNMLHRVNEFPELYEALQRSADYFVFLDADEYLTYLDSEKRLHNGKMLLQYLPSEPSGVLPGSWLENVQGYEDRFWYDLRQNHVMAGLRSGKPLVSSAAPVSGLINHNRQVPLELYNEKVIANFFVLHLKRLSVAQRVAANMRKLHAYNAFKRVLSLEEVLLLDPDDYPAGNKRNWVREVQTLTQRGDREVATDAPLAPGTVRIEDGRLLFSLPEQEAALSDLLRSPWEHLQRALEEAKPPQAEEIRT